MKYFLHDTSAFQDEKITELYLKFGYEGLGLFYTILEKIGLQEKPIKTEVLKAQLKVGKKLDKCWSFMEEIGIISSNNGDTFNERILSYSETYQIKKEKTRERVEKFRSQQHVKQTDEVNGNALQKSYNRVSNAPKVKESKVNKEIYREHVKLLKEENDKLASELGQDLTDACYDHLNDYKVEKNYKTNSDYLTIKRWVVQAVKDKQKKQGYQEAAQTTNRLKKIG